MLHDSVCFNCKLKSLHDIEVNCSGDFGLWCVYSPWTKMRKPIDRVKEITNHALCWLISVISAPEAKYNPRRTKFCKGWWRLRSRKRASSHIIGRCWNESYLNSTNWTIVIWGVFFHDCFCISTFPLTSSSVADPRYSFSCEVTSILDLQIFCLVGSDSSSALRPNNFGT